MIPPPDAQNRFEGIEMIHTRLQWPMRGDSLVWEVVASRLDIAQHTILETWADGRIAMDRARQLTRERINALPDYTETRQ